MFVCVLSEVTTLAMACVLLLKRSFHCPSLTHRHAAYRQTHTPRDTQQGSFRCGTSNITSLRQNARNSALLEKPHIFVCVFLLPSVHICVCVCVCLHLYVCACLHLYVCMYVCVCVCQGVLEAGRGLAEQKRANLSALSGQTTLLTLIQRHIDSPLHPTGEGVCVCVSVQGCVCVRKCTSA